MRRTYIQNARFNCVFGDKLEDSHNLLLTHLQELVISINRRMALQFTHPMGSIYRLRFNSTLPPWVTLDNSRINAMLCSMSLVAYQENIGRCCQVEPDSTTFQRDQHHSGRLLVIIPLDRLLENFDHRRSLLSRHPSIKPYKLDPLLL